VTPVDFPWRPLGEHLVERGFIVPRELEAALAEQERTGRKLGEILVSRGAITGAQLTRVLVEQAGLRLEPAEAEPATSPAAPAAPSESYEGEPWRPLGRVLVDRGVLAQAELEEALHVQRESGRRLGEILVERGYVTAQTLVSAVIAQHGLEEETPTAAVVATPAAGEEIYQVEDHSSNEEEARVVFRSEAFLDAVDFAFEYLEAESPERLRIFRVLGRKREEVWTYGREAAAEIEEQPRDLLDVYGYDVMNWRGPGTA
jgi:predicted nucleic acid-binding protein